MKYVEEINKTGPFYYASGYKDLIINPHVLEKKWEPEVSLSNHEK